jgi:hypothetical protein
MRRRVAEMKSERQAPRALRPEYAKFLANYYSKVVPRETVDAIRSDLEDIMSWSTIPTLGSFSNFLTTLTQFLAWRRDQGLETTLVASMTYSAIDSFCSQNDGRLSLKTVNCYRSRLRRLAAEANPTLANPTPPRYRAYQRIRPGYTPVEEAAIKRVAMRQSSTLRRCQVCLIVGLASGAGLDATDLKLIERRHIDDRENEGIWLTVPGPRARTTVVRRSYEEVVRTGIRLLRTKFAIHDGSMAKNRVSEILYVIENFDAEAIDAARLRTTWLTWVVDQPIPLATVMAASGLRTARSFADLLADIDLSASPAFIPNNSALRGNDS